MEPAPLEITLPPRPPIEIPIRSRRNSRVRGGDGDLRSPGAGFKRLIVTCDGTWLNADNGLMNGKIAVPSNVTRLSRAIKPVSKDGIHQTVYYHYGIGSQGGIVDKVVGGTTGEGLSDAVREGYSFLANNYAPGDELFLIGFSRGAFTARSIAGVISTVGLLTKRGLPSLAEVYKDVQHRRDPNYRPKLPDVPFPRKPSANDPRYVDELERRGLTRYGIPIKVVGVWDTVGSLGTPRIGWLTRVGIQSSESKEMAFYDTKLSNNIENAFQALALDERRSAFSPAVWEKPEGNRTTLRQVWFPGVHSNVGGGYDDQQLSNITLAWMMSQLEPFLDMNMNYVHQADEENVHYYRSTGQKIRPWSFGELYNSMTGVYAIGGGTTRTPGLNYAVDPDTGRATQRPLRDTHEYVHPSARTRFKLQGPGTNDKGVYECRALTDHWRLVVDPTRTNDKGDPDIYWKLRSGVKDKGERVTTRILPEAPLWQLERELAATDRKTYDYVRRPPATGSGRSKKRRTSRANSVDMGNNGRSRVGGRSRDVDARSPPPMPLPRSSRARSLDRESEFRQDVRKDRTWWEGQRSPELVEVRDGRRTPRPRDSVAGGGRGSQRNSRIFT